MADAALPAPTAPMLPGGGAIPGRLNGLMANPAVRRSLPALAGLGMLGVAGALYLSLSNGPERVLYASLTDEERAGVTAAQTTHVDTQAGQVLRSSFRTPRTPHIHVSAPGTGRPAIAAPS